MEKKSGSKVIIIVLLVLLVLGAAGGGVYYFYQKQAPFRKLGELGYNEQQITVIKIPNNNTATPVIVSSFQVMMLIIFGS